MITDTLLTGWVGLTPLQRSAVREVYVRDRSLTDAATRLRTGVAEVSRALAGAYHRLATAVSTEDDGAGPARVAATLRGLATAPSARWTWNTSREDMNWSDGMYDLYGYPVGAVRPVIGLHQSHKQHEDRAAVERLVLTSATERGPVVFPQRIIRTDGTICRVVMHVVREPGPGEVLTGRVVADVV